MGCARPRGSDSTLCLSEGVDDEDVEGAGVLTHRCERAACGDVMLQNVKSHVEQPIRPVGQIIKAGECPDCLRGGPCTRMCSDASKKLAPIFSKADKTVSVRGGDEQACNPLELQCRVGLSGCRGGIEVGCQLSRDGRQSRSAVSQPVFTVREGGNVVHQRYQAAPQRGQRVENLWDVALGCGLGRLQVTPTGCSLIDRVEKTIPFGLHLVRRRQVEQKRGR